MGVGIPDPKVLALISALCDCGILVSSDHGEALFELSASEEARYREFDDPAASASSRSSNVSVKIPRLHL